MADHVKENPSPWLTLARRGKLYRIATALGLLALFYGLVSAEALPLWMGLVLSILGNGTASAFTPAKAGSGE